MDEIITRKLAHKELVNLVIHSQTPLKLSLEFQHNHSGTKDDKPSFWSITDEKEGKINYSVEHKLDTWRYDLIPGFLFIDLSNSSNISLRESLIEGAVRKGYIMSAGTMVFAHGKRNFNPSEAQIGNTFADISEDRIRLRIGKTADERLTRELGYWIRKYT